MLSDFYTDAHLTTPQPSSVRSSAGSVQRCWPCLHDAAAGAARRQGWRCILLVAVADGSFRFDVAVVPGETFYIDPYVAAVGYTYAIALATPASVWRCCLLALATASGTFRFLMPPARLLRWRAIWPGRASRFGARRAG